MGATAVVARYLELLAEDNVVGVVRGRAEHGPRLRGSTR